MKTKEIRKILLEKQGVNRVRITRNGDVHLHVVRAREDNVAAPWWVYIGKIADIRQEMMEKF